MKSTLRLGILAFLFVGELGFAQTFDRVVCDIRVGRVVSYEENGKIIFNSLDHQTSSYYYRSFPKNVSDKVNEKYLSQIIWTEDGKKLGNTKVFDAVPTVNASVDKDEVLAFTIIGDVAKNMKKGDFTRVKGSKLDKSYFVDIYAYSGFKPLLHAGIHFYGAKDTTKIINSYNPVYAEQLRLNEETEAAIENDVKAGKISREKASELLDDLTSKALSMVGDGGIASISATCDKE